MVELRVRCDWKDNNIISVLEYKGKMQHGIAIHFDTLWRKRDSSFYVNGENEGQCLYWDTLGNMVAKESYRKGRYVGRQEAHWSPGRPSLLKHYNTLGKEDGPWKEWWKNGNPKIDVIAKNGRIISGTEYYPDGKPRLRFKTKDGTKSETLFKRKYIEGEAWAPKGESTGRINEGDGEWIVFSAEPDTTKARYNAYREVYKDSLLVKVHKLDSSEIARWLE